MRLTHTRQFDAVYKARVRTSAGPLVVWAAPNDLGHPRLGLAISRRLGAAAARNRVKRHIRESFRLLQAELSAAGCGYDLVVNVRGHAPMTQSEYQEALLAAARALQTKWARKLDSSNHDGGSR